MSYDFSGKTALITGAGGGISGACAELFYRYGANLVLTDLNFSAIEATAKRLDPQGNRVVALAHDVSSSQQAQSVVELAAKTFGGIDFLSPGAGLYLEQALSDMTDAEWSKLIRINLDGVFYTVRAATPFLREAGAIVTIASMAGHKGSFRHGHYAAAKGGVLTLTRTLALELAPRIRVNAVSPGLIETLMVSSLIAANGRQLIEQTPLKRLGTSMEIAEAAAFLCSDAASFITAETLHVNGGLYIAS
ncbi:SDR family NAD(P)-dependent oxidoreductase [Bradyrhizobium yuanmingense]|uniref:SDR family NAD(P)-dependent oxidoreductase n=1 Tax=Bradyrhizobium yuanmingense TaxID=108015 RepID=UPI0023B8C3C3|nr:SDR family NAD(P)-dependent oxidoreductase [Bradyrhizobium yuanmingense]MDF0523335.1 SDR family NAD(P)-dependent oxidoreductase [Bradyrhizobium yuanmingense]